jgi:hypothetical protein
MIRRFVFFRFLEPYRTKQAMDEIISRTHAVLGDSKGVVSYEVGTAADSKSLAAWDLSITATFADRQSLEAYIVHPVHRAYVDAFIKPRLEVIKAWNFRGEGLPSEALDPLQKGDD